MPGLEGPTGRAARASGDDTGPPGAADEVADAGAGDGEPPDGGPGDDGRPGDDLTEAQLEALLFVAERPLARRELMSITGASRHVVDARLGDLEMSLGSRGLRVLLSGDRVALGTAPEAGPLVARYVGSDAVRLSPASLETLAIVAYRQPVTRSVVERIRGVDSDYTIRALLHRRLIIELGRAEAPGRPILYGTGFGFLERFGLVSLEELPPLDAELETRLLEIQGGGEVAPAKDERDPTDPEAAPADDSEAAAADDGAPTGPDAA